MNFDFLLNRKQGKNRGKDKKGQTLGKKGVTTTQEIVTLLREGLGNEQNQIEVDADFRGGVG